MGDSYQFPSVNKNARAEDKVMLHMENVPAGHQHTAACNGQGGYAVQGNP